AGGTSATIGGARAAVFTHVADGITAGHGAHAGTAVRCAGRAVFPAAARSISAPRAGAAVFRTSGAGLSTVTCGVAAGRSHAGRHRAIGHRPGRTPGRCGLPAAHEGDLVDLESVFAVAD